MTKERFHEAHMLTYAIAMDGQFVNVDDVKTGQECECICPACKEHLVAKNRGKVRIHHFAHKSGTECSFAFESMLHLLAKERVQKTFLGTNCFYLDFEYRSYCPQNKQCNFLKVNNCYTPERKRFNLKDFYDSCEQEVPYDRIKRRSDLKLFSSTNSNLPPIYIEFCVTHASDQEKLHSGNRIIECIIEDESDIDSITQNGFVEDKCSNDLYNRTTQDKVQIYGFSNSDYNNKHISSEIALSRFLLFKSGKTHCERDLCNCKDYKTPSRSSLYEICFHTTDAFNVYEYAKYLAYDKFHIPNCLLCKNYVDSYNGTGKICRLYKYLQLPKYEKLDTSRARNCHRFYFNQNEHDKMIHSGINVTSDEIYCSNKSK